MSDDLATISTAEVALHLAGGTATDWLRLRRRFGRRAHVLGLSRDAWRAAGLSAALVERLAALRERGVEQAVEQERAAWRRHAARAVAHGHVHYPGRLRQLPRPPLLLLVRGDWPPPDPCLAIVGSRAATPYGRHCATWLARAAARSRIGVVSGLARGIDRYALEAAVGAGGVTLGVLGCGLDVVYPRENAALQGAMTTLVSEFPMGTRPSRFSFPRRNRIIAALARAVLVVEAGERSGALITAEHALELGRDVWTVPGPIDAPQSIGCNRLLVDGATPIVHADDVARLLGVDRRDEAADESDAILRALGTHALASDTLAARLDMPPRLVKARLLELELEGRIRRVPGGAYVRAVDGRWNGRA